jgi:copper(I)-binding protein
MKSILLAAALGMSATLVDAHEYKAGLIEIKHPWSRATPKGASVAGGYMTLVNKGAVPDRLLSFSSPVAGKFEIHEMKMDNGIMKMRPLAGGIELKPGETVEFKPGSFHLMFVGLTQPFEQGKRINATLTFEKAGKVDVEYVVEAMGTTKPAAPDHGKMQHGH